MLLRLALPPVSAAVQAPLLIRSPAASLVPPQPQLHQRPYSRPAAGTPRTFYYQRGHSVHQTASISVWGPRRQLGAGGPQVEQLHTPGVRGLAAGSGAATSGAGNGAGTTGGRPPGPWWSPAAMGVADGPQQPEPTQLEQFFGLAKAHLRRGPLRTTQSVAEIRAAMGRIPLEELGFTSKALQDPQLGMHYHGQNFSEGGPSHVTYLQIHEDLELTLGVFCFPPGASIPLHNHPGMTVLSRLLFGRLRVTAYDWVGPDTAAARALRRRPARQVVDTTLVSPAEPLALFPSDGGNIHEFVAETACAVLDLLTPPYDAQNGRDCLYFKVSSEGSGEKGPASGPSAVHKAAQSLERVGASSPIIVELEEHDPPDEFEVVRGDYCGVQLS